MKPKGQTEVIKNNPSRATIIFNDVNNKRKKMSEFYDSVDNNKLYFEYVGPTKGVRFYEYMGSKQLFNKLKDNRIRFSDALKKQELLKKINEVKIGHKNTEQEKVVKNLEGFYKSRENVFNFF